MKEAQDLEMGLGTPDQTLKNNTYRLIKDTNGRPTKPVNGRYLVTIDN